MSDFIEFPPRDEIVRTLEAVDDSGDDLAPLHATIGDRLASRTYERSASAFILIEIVYDYEETHGHDMSHLLPRYVMSLTEDRDLALSALGAYNEIKDAIRMQAPPQRGEEATQEIALPLPEPVRPAPVPPPAPEPPPPPSESDVMMAKLQNAQKALADLGLSTRVSIDMTMRRATRERVSRTLQDISALRTALRRFEELLSQSEVQVLEAAGVLWGGEEDGEG